MPQGNDPVFRQIDGTFHHIMQFPHIAGPVILQEKLWHGRIDRIGYSLFFRQSLQKMPEQQQNVFAAFAQWRYRNRNHIQAIIQILPEYSLRHRLDQVLVRRANQPHIRGNHPVAADPGHGFFFNDPQQGRLLFQRHIADLVQKEGPAGGQFEFSRPALPPGPGKSAPFVTEQFAADQFPWNRAAVQRDIGTAAPGAAMMDRLSKQFFAGSAFALQQHVGISGRCQHRNTDCFPDRRALADDVAEPKGRNMAAETIHQTFDLIDGPQDDDSAAGISLFIGDRFPGGQTMTDAGFVRDHQFHIGVGFANAQHAVDMRGSAAKDSFDRVTDHFVVRFFQHPAGNRIRFVDDPRSVQQNHAVGHRVEYAGQAFVRQGQLLVFPLHLQLHGDRFRGCHDHAERVRVTRTGGSRNVQHRRQLSLFIQNRRGRTGPAMMAETKMFRPGNLHWLSRRQYTADRIGADVIVLPFRSRQKVKLLRAPQPVVIAEQFQDISLGIGQYHHEA